MYYFLCSLKVAKFIDLDIQLMELKCKCEAIENCKNEMKDQVNLLKKKTVSNHTV